LVRREQIEVVVILLQLLLELMRLEWRPASHGYVSDQGGLLPYRKQIWHLDTIALVRASLWDEEPLFPRLVGGCRASIESQEPLELF
jgi:hypothetical protein